MRTLPLLLLLLRGTGAGAQVCVWAEEFENGCATGCYATAYTTGPNGAWGVTNTGSNGSCANRWFISCAENGNAVGACGTGCGNNETLHVGNQLVGVCASPNGCAFCPAGDCGAAYDAGCPAGLCAICTLLCGNCLSTLTDQRAESPVINLTGFNTITLSFKYMENGQGAQDNATAWYFNGVAWALLADMPKSAGSCSPQGIWTSFSVALPASANNNPSVRIGFRWVNDNDGNGADPSFAVDDLQLTVPYAPTCLGPLVNEASNGPSGTKEYIELLVCGAPCTTFDLRNWKLDDNNGVLMNGFGTTMTGSGTAAGHLRFSSAAQWAIVPVGSLIVIYNNADPNALMPPDDPDDTAPNDSVYILPASHALLQGCSTTPNPTSTSSYSPACVFGAGNWNYVSLRNQGDAAQTRAPSGAYFHGISYGSNANGMNNGGIDLLRISTLDHAGRVLFFNAGNPRLAAGFTSALVAGNETPGAPNNAANAAYIAALQCITLPIELLSFTAAPVADRVRLRWVTATETNNDLFILERSRDAVVFGPIGTVDGAGTSLTERHYVFDDSEPIEGRSYYRLRQVDLDGGSSMSGLVAVDHRRPGTVSVRVEAGVITISGTEGPGRWRMIDPTGRTIAGGDLSEPGPTRAFLPPPAAGVMIVRVETAHGGHGIRIPFMDDGAAATGR